jgi:hypothetical protein
MGWTLTVTDLNGEANIPSLEDLENILELIGQGYIEGEIDSTYTSRLFWKISNSII